ncbi:hypothetical protein N7456_000248 [Penicillium angulare]|uniref:HD/PDEase domain-containing protein n=1 Tax=Penicillium angulare TaxID=116970 RepID=A0A9W9GCM6_9EURO|nr:hypothetical protein N7456_000248 [Penicillium angulare]
MSSQINTGFLQTLETINDKQVIIRDKIYGEHTITEPVLSHLLQSPELLRLSGVCQHGVTALLGFGPPSDPLRTLIRKVGASVEEQIAALLHDISHTSLSHVVDFALSKPGEGSYHEFHKARYLKTSQLPQILTQYGFGDLKALDEELFPLVEMPAPQLCADRLDYSLRDAVAFDKLPLKEVQRVYETLKAAPSPDAPNRLLVLDDPQLALAYARAYLSTDQDVWSNRAHADLYLRTGSIIRELVESGRIKEEVLWILSDDDFWALLRQKATPDILHELDRLETERLPDEKQLRLPRGTKIRTIDPDIWSVGSQDKPLPLSVVLPEWGLERQQYIDNRESTRE